MRHSHSKKSLMRALRLESLEDRRLLSVTGASETFKTWDFTANGPYDGHATVLDAPEPGDTLEVHYFGSCNLNGQIEYTSPTEGTWTAAEHQVTGTGDYDATITNEWGTFPDSGSYSFTAHGQLTDNNGSMTGQGYADSFTDLPVPMPTGPYPATATFATSDFSVVCEWDWNVLGFNTFGNWTGTMVPNAGPFDAYPDAASWNGDNLDVSFVCTGSPVNAPSHTTPVGEVQFYWASGTTFADAIPGGPFADTLPIYWNQATGSATITELPTAPAGATHLLVYVDGNYQIDEADETNNVMAVEIPFGGIPPVADANGPYGGEPGESIPLDGSGSYDPDGTIVSYAWDLDHDGEYDDATGATPDFVSAVAGEYTIALRVTDNDGATGTDTATVTVAVGNVAPVADAGGPYSGEVGEWIPMDVSGSYDTDGTIVSYDWDLDFDGEYDDYTGAMLEISYPMTGEFTIALRVTDDDGATGTDTATVTVTDPGPVAEYDFGDAPDPSYPTLLASDGARHAIDPTLCLGSSIDSELDGLPSDDATGDDLDNADDEDGIVLNTPAILGEGLCFTVTASKAGYLDAWADVDQSGSWDAYEQFLASMPVTAGDNTLPVAIPAGSVLGETFVRFRLSSIGGLDPTGLAVDGEVEDIQINVQQTVDTVGLYAPDYSAFFLNNANATQNANIVCGYGPGGLGWIPLIGDWDGDGVDTLGLYAPDSSTFFLNNANATQAADVVFGYGPGGLGWIPLVGDWDGDGIDTVGLYAPDSGMFFLNNANETRPADFTFGYGPGGLKWEPVVGDWNGDGFDTVGLYVPTSSAFFLNNEHATQNADLVFGYGPGGLGWQPLTGDWDGDGVDTVGLYAPTSSTFFLNNANATQNADVVFGYGPGDLGWLPLTGDYNGPSSPLHAAGEPSGAAEPLAEADVEAILSQAAADWAAQRLAGIDVVITDLPGTQVGLAELDTIYLDRDAAGHGWFVDPTPGDDEEFQATADGTLQAVDARAVDRIDLLTVVSHELGHVLGLEDLDASADSVMSGTLQPGLRRAPSAAEIDAVLGQI